MQIPSIQVIQNVAVITFFRNQHTVKNIVLECLEMTLQDFRTGRSFLHFLSVLHDVLQNTLKSIILGFLGTEDSTLQCRHDSFLWGVHCPLLAPPLLHSLHFLPSPLSFGLPCQQGSAIVHAWSGSWLC
jgi:hypothetical protein